MDLKVLEEMAVEEFGRHGLTDWTFRVADTKRRLGVCKYRYKRIEIADYYAKHSPDATVRDTLLHEIAHAIVGHAAGHGPAWKEVAVRVGAIPRACDNSPDTVQAPGDWQATCSGCQRTHHRYKKPKSLTGYICRCSTRAPLVFEYKGVMPVRPAVPPPPTAKWLATCAGCGTIHYRFREPKAGLWRCQCPLRCELTWMVDGIPVMSPPPPAAAKWQATCAGCGTIHVRSREPKAGLWKCRCPHRCELTWQFVDPAGPG